MTKQRIIEKFYKSEYLLTSYIKIPKGQKPILVVCKNGSHFTFNTLSQAYNFFFRK